MQRRLIIAIAILLVIVSLTTGIILASNMGKKETNFFTYPVSVGGKTYIVTMETNWDAEPAPAVTLLNSSFPMHAIELYFLGGSEKTITYNITIPTDLLWGKISLIWKYYEQEPDRYTLSNNGTHNSIKMTFDYDPSFSGKGYFEIVGTEAAW